MIRAIVQDDFSEIFRSSMPCFAELSSTSCMSGGPPSDTSESLRKYDSKPPGKNDERPSGLFSDGLPGVGEIFRKTDCLSGPSDDASTLHRNPNLPFLDVEGLVFISVDVHRWASVCSKRIDHEQLAIFGRAKRGRNPWPWRNPMLSPYCQ